MTQLRKILKEFVAKGLLASLPGVPEDVVVISAGEPVNEVTVPAMVTDAFGIGPVNALRSLKSEYEDRMRVLL